MTELDIATLAILKQQIKQSGGDPDQYRFENMERMRLTYPRAHQENLEIAQAVIHAIDKHRSALLAHAQSELDKVIYGNKGVIST